MNIYTIFYILHVSQIVALGRVRLDDLRTFPKKGRRIAGHQLHLIQHGLKPFDWKPSTAVASGVNEIRIHARGEYRVFYVAKFPETVYVLHAFEKKTRRTRRADIELARDRFRTIQRTRKRRGRRLQE